MQAAVAKEGKKPLTKVGEYLTAHLESGKLDKPQGEIAKAIGFESGQALTMMKQGKTKVPINRVPALAREIGANAPRLLRLVIEEHYGKQAAKDLFELFNHGGVSQNERRLLDFIREASDDNDPIWSDDMLKKVADIIQ